MAKSQAPLSLEHILPGLLCLGPAHGYDLYKKINNFEGISLVWHIKQSLLYAVLDKLEIEWLDFCLHQIQGRLLQPAGAKP